MVPKLRRFAKRAVMLGCAALCLWCGALRVGDWARAQGAQALLFAAGLGEEAAPAGASPSPSPTPQEAQAPLPDDGIVPFHENELPQLAAPTPDPGRDWAPVEETLIQGGGQVADFFVKDTTNSGTDLEAELAEPSPVSLKSDGSVEVLIYHTHTSEAYSRDFTGFYYTDMETRTGDPDQSVAAVGEEIKKVLEEAGIGAVHDTTVNDTLYNGSYARSWEVLRKNLAEHPGIQVTIDVHRDSMTTEAGTKYKPTAVINGKKAAQIMFLAGCDADGSWGDFPNWRQNLRLILRPAADRHPAVPGSGAAVELLQQQVQHERHYRLPAGGGGHRGEHRGGGEIFRQAGGGRSWRRPCKAGSNRGLLGHPKGRRKKGAAAWANGTTTRFGWGLGSPCPCWWRGQGFGRGLPGPAAELWGRRPAPGGGQASPTAPRSLR